MKTGAAGAHRAEHFRPDIEGLRAVAVMLVALDHADIGFLAGGYIGVDVFFVISGFLITSLLLREVGGPSRRRALVNFYARRVKRLLPAATLVLFVTVMAAYHYLGFLRGDDVAIDARWCAAFVGNIRFALVGTNYLGAQEPPSPLQHFWSLGVEEQFYLVWPSMMLLVAAVVPRRHLRISIGILLGIVISASLAWSYLQTNSDPGWAYFSPLTRAWELGVGASIAIGAPLVSRISPRLAIPISWIGLIGIVASAFIIDGATPFPGIAAIAPVLATALVIVGGAVGSGGGAVALLRRLPFQWVGKLSYSFYLWHWPILVIAAQHAGKRLSVAHNLVLLTGALALSAVTFYTVESPVRRSRALRGKDPIVVVVGLCLVIFTIAVSSWTLSRHAGII
ncbi:MAG: hypothetical protein QOF79_1513 [Actinomycetota bacterium]|nr:hypothetical protein [Actinomycetota bacterium]